MILCVSTWGNGDRPSLSIPSIYSIPFQRMTGSSTLFIGSVPPQIQPDITKMHFQYMTPCLNYSVPLLKAEKLWNHPKFRQNHKLVILATGWTNTVNDSATIAMISRAFMCRPAVNFVVLSIVSTKYTPIYIHLRL